MKSNLYKNLLTYTIPLSLAIIFLVIKYLVKINGTIGEFIIFEGDYRNIYPYIENPQVTSEQLAFICLVPVWSFISNIIIQFIIAFYYQHLIADRKVIIEDIAICLYFLLFTYMTLTFTMMFTEIIKNVFAMPRPNFFHMCNYQQINTNFSYYLENIIIGKIVDISNCYSDHIKIEESISSFPSDHSSYTLSIAISSFLFTKYTKRRNTFFIFVFMMFFLSFYVGISRIMDYYHNVWDVMFGFFLAICVNLIFVFSFHESICYIMKDDEKFISGEEVPPINNELNSVEI